jgi:transposase, IS6 family
MGMQCDRCAGEAFTKAGWDRLGRQLWRCQACGRRLTVRSTSVFSGYRFPDEVIALAVRWYLRFRLSYVDVAEWLAERGITVDPSTIYDWVYTFTLRFIEAARRHRHAIGHKWRVDEPLFKIGRRWRYAFGAIDENGQIIDVFLSEHRDAASARAFFEQAITSTDVTPTRVTTDKAKCYPPALQAVLPNVEHRLSHYLNNGLERDHQHLKGRTRPMRHFKRLARANTFCRGHALIRNLRQGFSDLTAGISPQLRLATASTVLTPAI